ncbi:TPA: restriction endonuclease subunit S [Staphylococcus aureus]|uniref:restriction endonuclease subunit S n=1 Tax=Staphylococcus aureus TaxID=1280 RepID=UPI0022030746|nr:restriction endonuclease subunit S [Staphylococcus aureus]HCW3602072.1 restriction endonuclease subunit S [Staphylococcus aureus]HCW3606681.1 restriction endonuclease subunit S [Staphylococcus aureus]HDT6306251.1 restriction endonuclease subunit S [Staphylococcus aureus]HDT6320480.1 restriction endonuclease subunit S [Staphylococcus aureus]
MSNTQKKNVPELRFPEFEGEWEEKKLEDIGTLKNGINKDKESFGYGFPFVNLNDVFNSKEIQIKNLSLINSTYKEREEYNLQKGDTLFIRSSVKPSGVGLTKVIEIDLKNVVFSGFLIRFRNNNLAVNFKKFIFNSISVRKQILSLSSTSANTNINQESLKKVKIPIPCMDEQQKIGQFFSKLDRQIELEEQKLELIQQQKKGYMQKIFSQELRFKDENGNDYPDWEEKQLGEVAEIIGGGTPSTKNKLYWNGEINWFSPIEIGNKAYVYSSQKKITEEGLRKSSAKILPVGTILFTSRAGIGKTAILAKESTTNQGFQSIVPRKGVLDSYYVYTISNILKILAEKVGAGSTFSEISKKQMEQLNLNIPMIKEQKNISNFFSKFDNLIEIYERKLEFLKQRKQSLLQKMFV